MLSLGLLGYPLLHSLSPRLHGAALHSLGLEGEYRLYPIPPLPEGASQLADLFQSLRAGKIDGLNVTIPHKQTVLPYLDNLTETAQSIGAVNTIFLQDGRWVGDNTDAPGFLSDLNRLLPGKPPQSQALVLGAGGAARGVVYSLLSAGWQVRVAARSLEQAQAMATSLLPSGEGWSPARPLLLNGGISQHLPATLDLIVNATSAGMAPDVESSPWPAGVSFPRQAFVYDLVYKPPETAFLLQARVAGLPAANGLGMLVEQAALALERWSGRSVPRQAMWQAIRP
jgi:shikimate dehydrogenase